MMDLTTLRNQFFAALDERRLADCKVLLELARMQPISLEEKMWVKYLQAIYLIEQEPPRWDLADQILAELLNADLPSELRARVYLERAIVADYQGDYQQAIHYNQHSLKLFELLNDRMYMTQVLINTGIAHTHAFEYEKADQEALSKALACHEHALTICRELNEEGRAARVALELGTVYKALGRWEDARQSYTEAANQFRCLAWQRRLALALNNLGEVHHHWQQREAAIQCYQEALQIFANLPAADPYEEADIQANIALHYQALGQIDKAISASDRAITLIEQIRSPLESETARVGFFGTRFRIYKERIDLELEQGQPAAALTILERTKSRTFIELLAGRIGLPARGFPQPSFAEQTSLHQVDPLTAQQIQQRLPTNTVLLEYFVSNERACVFVVTHHRLTVMPLHANLQALLKRQFEWKQQRPARLTPDRSGRLRQPWSLPMLYRLLLEPISDQLKGFARLCIVPHGSLHYIPFHALVDETAGPARAFIEREDSPEIIYAPSATVLLDYCRTKPPGRGKGGMILAYGKNLSFAQKEGQAIGNILDGQLYLNAAATREAVQRDSANYPILHFACHGAFDAEKPLASGLDLFDGRLSAAHMLEHLHLQADLVTLSACETGRSQLYRGDELIGLTRAFIYAGTPSVLVSLWQADDFATRILMEKFYHELIRGLSPALALRNAQRFLLRLPAARVWQLLCDDGFTSEQAVIEVKRLLMASGFPADQTIGDQTVFAHPYYWAPFFLVGDRLKS